MIFILFIVVFSIALSEFVRRRALRNARWAREEAEAEDWIQVLRWDTRIWTKANSAAVRAYGG